MTLTILIIILLLLLQGFFSGSEIALVSADRMRLEADQRRGSRGASLAIAMLDQPARMLGTCLIGTNLSAIGTATLAAKLVMEHLAGPPALAALLVLSLNTHLTLPTTPYV